MSRINNKYSTLTYQPVVFLHVQDITFSQYSALLTVADCFLATSLREGMNLTSHEFVVCQEVSHTPLVLSEFTGTYSGLRACIGINPWNTKQVAHAIHKALTMDESEMVQRWTDLHRVVVTQTRSNGSRRCSAIWSARISSRSGWRTCLCAASGSGAARVRWRAAHSRLLLIDLEETLVKHDPLLAHEQGGFRPPEWLFTLLNDLAADGKNVVYILSGMGTHDLERVATRIDSVGFVAETAALSSTPARTTGTASWRRSTSSRCTTSSATLPSARPARTSSSAVRPCAGASGTTRWATATRTRRSGHVASRPKWPT